MARRGSGKAAKKTTQVISASEVVRSRNRMGPTEARQFFDRVAEQGARTPGTHIPNPGSAQGRNIPTNMTVRGKQPQADLLANTGGFSGPKIGGKRVELSTSEKIAMLPKESRNQAQRDYLATHRAEFDEKKGHSVDHPRHPAGTPGGKGGEFKSK